LCSWRTSFLSGEGLLLHFLEPRDHAVARTIDRSVVNCENAGVGDHGTEIAPRDDLVALNFVRAADRVAAERDVALPSLNSALIWPEGSRYFPSPPPLPQAAAAKLKPTKTKRNIRLRIEETFMVFSLD
jgi:hypothetical protein